MPVSSIKSLLELEVEMSGWSEAEAAASSLESTLNDLEGGVTIEVDLDAPDVSALEDLNDTDISPTLDVQESEDTKSILDGVNFLVALEKIKLVIDVIGTAVNFVADLGALAINPFLDVEDAVARINAQTGTNITDLDQLIRDLQASDLGDSVEQIADVAIAAQQIGAPMEAAARAALTFTHTFDENPETVLGALNTMVETKLTPNLQEAADLMTVFFQQGGNVGGDALAVVNSNSQSWSDMGLTAAEALSTLDSLQQGTGATATEAAKMLQTFDDAMTAAAADPTSEQNNLLRLMGITNPKDAGEAIGAETIDGFADAFANLPSDKQDLISGLFFGKGGKKFTGAIEGMTTQGGPFADYIGAAEEAAKAIDDSLRGAIDDFVLEINTSIARLLSSEEIDLPGKIAALKEGFQAAAETLAEGGSLGDALSVGFHIEGVDTALGNVERVFGNLVIALLQVVASVQDFTGHGDQAEITRGKIANLATQQLPFDLKLANPEEVGSLVNAAVANGVDPDAVAALAGTAVTELINSGDFDKAQTLLDSVAQLPADLINNAGVLGIDSASLNKQLGDAGLQTQLFDPTDLQKQIDSAKAQVDLVFGPTAPPLIDPLAGMPSVFKNDSTNPFNSLKEIFKTNTDAATLAQTDITAAGDATAAAVATATDAVVVSAEGAALAVQLMDTDIAAAMMGNTVTASFQAVEDAAVETMAGTVAAVQSVFPTVLQLDALLRSVAAAAATVQQSVNTALTGAGAGAGGGGNTTNINVTNTNNVQSPAQAVANGYQLGAQIRGMA